MLRKKVAVCALVVVVVVVFWAGDLSLGARDFIQDRLAELRIALQQN